MIIIIYNEIVFVHIISVEMQRRSHIYTQTGVHTQSEHNLLLRTSLLLVSYALEDLIRFPCSATCGGNQGKHYRKRSNYASFKNFFFCYVTQCDIRNLVGRIATQN